MPEPAVIWLVGGVIGGRWPLLGVIRGLRDAGLTCEINMLDWQTPGASIANLWRQRAARQHAANLSRQIHRPADTVIIGFSAGAAPALWATAMLPEGARLRRLLLVQAAVSPTFDLHPALTRCERLVHLFSPRDRLILGFGTRLCGGMDRVRCDAAGKVGFRAPIEGGGFTQIAWTPAMRAIGHGGGHLGGLKRRFAREFLAHLVME